MVLILLFVFLSMKIECQRMVNGGVYCLKNVYRLIGIISIYSDDSPHDFLRKGVFYCEI